ncbi:MAG: peptidoglycan DD-metalloendopeptidase family protein [Bacteroidia bacterium]
MKTNKSVASLFALIFLAALAMPFVYAQSSKKKKSKSKTEVQDKASLEAKKQSIQAEIDMTNKMLKETRRNKNLSLSQLVTLNKKIEARERLIATINQEIAGLDSLITENNGLIADLNTEVVKLKENYARMVVFAYKNRNPFHRVLFVFASSDFNQAYRRMKYLQQISQGRRIQAENIAARQAELNDEVRALELKKSEKKKLLGVEEDEKKTLASEKDEKDKTFRDLQAKEKQLKDDLAKKKSQKASIDQAIQNLIAAEAKRLADKAKADADKKKNNGTISKTEPKTNEPKTNAGAPPKLELTPEAQTLSNSFADNKGALPWPVSQGTITERFGKHPHPVLTNVVTQNNGVDIATTSGANARAVYEGEVTGLTNIPGSGWLVIVRHGEYLTVYANLEEVFVKQGDKVKTKQAIGKVYTDNDGGTTELHFEVWQSGIGKMDPELWLMRSSKS